MTDGLAKLREPFPAHQISYLPKGGVRLAYVGHAALTDRLLDADPSWTWEPLAINKESGLPVIDELGGLWIRLTVCGVTRLGYGDAGDKSGPNAIKEAIGDALRNAAMRFGAALDLWHKGDLHKDEDETRQAEPAKFSAQHQATIRSAAAAAIQAFNEGKEWTAYEEVTSCIDKIAKGDSDARNNVLLALSTIFQPHAALRAYLKKQMQGVSHG